MSARKKDQIKSPTLAETQVLSSKFDISNVCSRLTWIASHDSFFISNTMDERKTE